MAQKDLLEQSLDNSGILHVTLNDEARRNALSEQMLAEMQAMLDEAGANAKVRVIILRAKGPAFCAGHNLKEMTQARLQEDGGISYFTEKLGQCSRMMQSIISCPKPLIAAVDGIATAAGCQLVATCDLAIASDKASFSTPGVHIGLFCSTPMVALSRNLSNKHAMEMLLTGDMIAASRAVEMGLVNQMVPSDQLDETVLALAQKIAAKSSHTIAIGKSAFYAQSEMPLQEAYDYASAVMVKNMMANDAVEGIDAFLTKRAAKWQDR